MIFEHLKVQVEGLVHGHPNSSLDRPYIPADRPRPARALSIFLRPASERETATTSSDWDSAFPLVSDPLKGARAPRNSSEWVVQGYPLGRRPRTALSNSNSGGNHRVPMLVYRCLLGALLGFSPFRRDGAWWGIGELSRLPNGDGHWTTWRAMAPPLRVPPGKEPRGRRARAERISGRGDPRPASIQKRTWSARRNAEPSLDAPEPSESTGTDVAAAWHGVVAAEGPL